MKPADSRSKYDLSTGAETRRRLRPLGRPSMGMDVKTDQSIRLNALASGGRRLDPRRMVEVLELVR